MREARPEIDWTSLLPEVARQLLGEPPRRSNDTWRYGNHGSLAVNVAGDRAGTWRDFEADEGGGTLDLVRRELQCDKAGALRWLEAEGLIERHAAHGSGTSSRTLVPRPTRPARQPQPNKTESLAAAILRVAVSADDTPVRVYLARRWTWPPLGIGPELPSAVRYVDTGNVPEGRSRHDGSSYRLLPEGAAGCVVFKLTDPAGKKHPAVNLEAITSDGHRLDWCVLPASRGCQTPPGRVATTRLGAMPG